MTFVGGAYSHALPGHATAREDLALPFEERLFFAGEATHTDDFATAYGTYDSGFRAAEEAIASWRATGADAQTDQPRYHQKKP
jgi:monoamine oxidase